MATQPDQGFALVPSAWEHLSYFLFPDPQVWMELE